MSQKCGKKRFPKRRNKTALLPVDAITIIGSKRKSSSSSSSGSNGSGVTNSGKLTPAVTAAATVAAKVATIYNAVICAILKDEPDVVEWLAYHRLLGFDHFFLYDNQSSVPLTTSLAAFADFVTITVWQGDQRQAYNDYRRLHRTAANWTAFIDGDEFIVLKRHATIGALLADFSVDSVQYESISLNWLMFDANGHTEDIDKMPDGLVIENYTRCAPQLSKCVKQIVRVAQAREINIHDAQLQHPDRQVDVVKRVMHGVSNEQVNVPADDGTLPCDVAYIHHYHTRSLAHWKARLRRGQPNTHNKRNAEQFWHKQRGRRVVDTHMQDRNWPERVRNFVQQCFAAQPPQQCFAAQPPQNQCRKNGAKSPHE